MINNKRYKSVFFEYFSLAGGKKCPDCGKQVYHEKWTIGEKLAEDRWAHRQARDRELAEVADFFQ